MDKCDSLEEYKRRDLRRMKAFVITLFVLSILGAVFKNIHIIRTSKAVPDVPRVCCIKIKTDISDYANMKSVDSECFSQIGYVKWQKYLFVRFRDSEAVYLYTNFPKDYYKSFTEADSLAEYFNSVIKGNFPCYRIYEYS